MERKKFKIMYPKDHPLKELAGKPFIAPQGSMIVMNQGGVFFIIHGVNDYDQTIPKLTDTLYKYDVIWK